MDSSYIFVKTEYRIERLNFNDILYVVGMKDYLQIHTKNKKIMTLLNFVTLLEYLPQENFIRVHKSYVVAVDKIKSVERKKIVIENIEIPIGETYREYFYHFLNSQSVIL